MDEISEKLMIQSEQRERSLLDRKDSGSIRRTYGWSIDERAETQEFDRKSIKNGEVVTGENLHMKRQRHLMRHKTGNDVP